MMLGIDASVLRFEGRVMARNDEDTVIRFRFPYEGKALRFRDEMIKLGVPTQVQPLNPTDMVIDLR
jgi:hypothetical protein